MSESEVPISIVQRVVIKFLTNENVGPNEIWRRLRAQYGESTLSKTEVKFWHKEFHRGRDAMQNTSHQRRPRTSITPREYRSGSWPYWRRLSACCGWNLSGAWYMYQLWECAVHHQNWAAVSKKFGPMGTHDNAKPHSATLTQEKLAQMYWTALEHSPYSPDLSPCDYDMLRTLKEALGGAAFRRWWAGREFHVQVATDTSSFILWRRNKKTPNPLAKMHRESWKLCGKVRIFLFCKITFQ